MRGSGVPAAAAATTTSNAGGGRGSGRAPGAAGAPGPSSAPRASDGWTPPAALVEEPETFFLLVELPGVGVEDLDISLRDRTVVIKGEKRVLGHEDPAVCFSDLVHGPFERQVRLPAPVMPDSLKTTLARGVVVLTILKRGRRAAAGRACSGTAVPRNPVGSPRRDAPARRHARGGSP